MATEETAIETGGLRAASALDDGSGIILEFETEPVLSVMVPSEDVPPMVALMCQTAGQAEAIAGGEAIMKPLEVRAIEGHADGADRLLLLCHLENGLDFPLSVTRQTAALLRDGLASTLASGFGRPPDTIQ